MLDDITKIAAESSNLFLGAGIMGIKLENAVNQLAGSSQKTSSILEEWKAFLKAQQSNQVEDMSNSQTPSSDFHKLQSSMDRMVNELHSFESMRAAMLEHEHLFKQQVKELHRLYGVQKMLMNELKHKESTTSTTCCGENNNLTKQECFGLENWAYGPDTAEQKREETRLAGNISGNNFNGYDEEEAQIELTLSIGNWKNSNNNRIKNTQLPQSINGHFEIKQQIPDQERKKPNWLLQSLSSHKT